MSQTQGERIGNDQQSKLIQRNLEGDLRTHSTQCAGGCRDHSRDLPSKHFEARGIAFTRSTGPIKGVLQERRIAAVILGGSDQQCMMLIATPEYNGGYPALLKNALDWASRPSESDPTGLEVFAGKVAAVVSASPGALGGMRAQIALQISLNKLGLLVIPNSFALGLAHQAFDEQRRLKDGNADQNVRGVGAALVRSAIALASTPKRSEHVAA